jgi:hypothetical protein
MVREFLEGAYRMEQGRVVFTDQTASLNRKEVA